MRVARVARSRARKFDSSEAQKQIATKFLTALRGPPGSCIRGIGALLSARLQFAPGWCARMKKVPQRIEGNKQPPPSVTGILPLTANDKPNPKRILVVFAKIIWGYQNAIKRLSFYRFQFVEVCRELREHQLNQ
jgi:hypothetical protein